MHLDLDNADQSRYTLGSEYDTLTGKQSSKIASLNSSINKQYEAVQGIDQTAKEAAAKADAAVVDSWDEYAVSDSNSDPPADGWSSDQPKWEEGRYIWRRPVTARGDGTTVEGSPAVMTGNPGRDGEDAVLVHIDSSAGNAFKNNSVSTVLRAVVFHGTRRLPDGAALRAEFGPTARVEWRWQRMGEDRFGTISASDSRLSEDGMALAISPADVDEKTDFLASLVVG